MSRFLFAEFQMIWNSQQNNLLIHWKRVFNTKITFYELWDLRTPRCFCNGACTDHEEATVTLFFFFRCWRFRYRHASVSTKLTTHEIYPVNYAYLFLLPRLGVAILSVPRELMCVICEYSSRLVYLQWCNSIVVLMILTKPQRVWINFNDATTQRIQQSEPNA